MAPREGSDARAIHDSVRELGLEVRLGLRIGEIELCSSGSSETGIGSSNPLHAADQSRPADSRSNHRNSTGSSRAGLESDEPDGFVEVREGGSGEVFLQNALIEIVTDLW